jgi:hypothetical protein
MLDGRGETGEIAKPSHHAAVRFAGWTVAALAGDLTLGKESSLRPQQRLTTWNDCSRRGSW